MGEVGPSNDVFERIHGAARWLEDVTSTRRVPTALGTALFHDEYPLRYDSNVLRLEGASGTLDVEEIVAECDRCFSGFGHREVVVPDERRGAALAPGFAERGWRVDRLVAMALQHPPAGAAEDVVVELTLDEAIDFGRRVHAASLDEPAEAVEMLASFRRVLRERADARFFGVRAGGEVVSACDLYVHGGAGQIESVDTIERSRGRGFARAVVTRAAREAEQAGCDLVWLLADEGDWPKELYVKLGFRPVARRWQFTLTDV